MQETLDLAIEANCEFANFYSAMAYPGSKLYSMAVEQGWALPENWIGYSQHSYESFPLRTENLTNAEVLKFRDEAFVKVLHQPALPEHGGGKVRFGCSRELARNEQDYFETQNLLGEAQ
ncbi:MAG: hypothetical protein R3B54_18525 [Bdellovibrionota bacterium]